MGQPVDESDFGAVMKAQALQAADRELTLEDEELRQVMLDKMQELREKIRRGELIPSFQIGSQSFTIEKWDKFLEKFDDVQEELREQLREETGSTEHPTEPEYTGIVEPEEPEQYDKVIEFLRNFSGMKNLRFAAHENSRQDFLTDRRDVEDFAV